MYPQKITARGQVTLRKEVLEKLGVQPGQKIEFDFDDSNNVIIRPIRQTGRIEDFFGILAGKTKVKATLEEIKEATERAWAGER